MGSVPESVTLEALAGGTTSLRSFRGRPLVLSFFASWCAPCREEFPILGAAAREHGERIAVVGVSIDEASAQSVARFARDRGITYPVLLDPAGATAGAALGVPPIPATFVLDRDGRVVFAHRGDREALEVGLAGAIEAALRTPTHTHEHAH